MGRRGLATIAQTASSRLWFALLQLLQQSRLNLWLREDFLGLDHTPNEIRWILLTRNTHIIKILIHFKVAFLRALLQSLLQAVGELGLHSVHHFVRVTIVLIFFLTAVADLCLDIVNFANRFGFHSIESLTDLLEYSFSWEWGKFFWVFFWELEEWGLFWVIGWAGPMVIGEWGDDDGLFDVAYS